MIYINNFSSYQNIAYIPIAETRSFTLYFDKLGLCFAKAKSFREISETILNKFYGKENR